MSSPRILRTLLVSTALCSPIGLQLSIPSPAHAQCEGDGSVDGASVTCSANDTDGVVISGSDVTLTQDEGVQLTNTADESDGDVIKITGDNSTLTLNGKIVIAEGISGAKGIELRGDSLASAIVLNGTITGSGDNVDGLSFANFSGANFTDAATAVAGSLSVTNNGTIEITGTNQFSDGIFVSDDSAAIINNGTITVSDLFLPRGINVIGLDNSIQNTGRVQVSGESAIGIWATGQRTTVDNSGEIIVSGGDEVGIQADADTFDNTGEVDGDFAITVNNSGLIQVGSAEASAGTHIGIRAEFGSVLVNNSGTIDGQAGGDPLVFFGEGNKLTNTGTVTSSGLSVDIPNEIISSSVNVFSTGNEIDNQADGAITRDGEGAVAILFHDNDGEEVVLEGRNTVTNAGTVMAETAIRVLEQVQGTVAIDLTNSGTITGHIDLESGADVLANTGAVTGNVTTGTGDDTLDNDGTVTGNVDLEGGNDTLDNAGSITGAVNTGDGNDTVNNTGSITGDVQTGAGNDTMTNSGSIEGNVNLGDGDDSFDMLEGGTLTGTVDGGAGEDDLTIGAGAVLDLSQALGFENVTSMAADGNATLSGEAELTDVKVESGSVDFDDANVMADSIDSTEATEKVEVNVSDDSTVTVTGGVNNGDGDSAVKVDGSLKGNVSLGGGTDDVEVNGSLEGDVDLGDGEDSIKIGEGGTVTGTVNGGAGNDTAVLNSTGTGNADLSNVSNVETLSKEGTGDFKVTGTNTFDSVEVEEGTLSINGNIGGPVAVMETGRLGGNGLITGTVTNSGVAAPGNSIDTLVINGDFVQGAGATLLIELENDGTADLLDISGTATLDGTLGLEFLSAADTYAIGTSYTVLEADGGITGGFAGITDVNDTFTGTFVDPAVTVGTNAVMVELERLSFVLPDMTANQQAVAGALDAAVGTAADELGTFINDLTFGQQAAAPAAVGQLASEAAAALPSAVFAGREQAVQLAAQSGAQTRGAGLWTTKLSGYGAFGDVDDAPGLNGFDYAAYGVLVSANYGLNGTTSLGFSVGAATTDLDAGGQPGNNDHSSVDFGLQLHHQGERAAFRASGLVSIEDYETRRAIAFADTDAVARSDANGTGFAAHAGLDYLLAERGNIAILPAAALDVLAFDRDAYQEAGAGNLGLAVEAGSLTAVRSSLGLSLRSAGPLDSGLTGYLNAFWVHELGDEERPLTAAFIGNPGTAFTTNAVEGDTDAARLEAGFMMPVSDSALFSARYRGTFGSNEQIHQVTVGLNWRW